MIGQAEFRLVAQTNSKLLSTQRSSFCKDQEGQINAAKRGGGGVLFHTCHNREQSDSDAANSRHTQLMTMLVSPAGQRFPVQVCAGCAWFNLLVDGVI